MLSKKQIILVVITIVAVAIALGTIFWMKRVDQMMQEPMPSVLDLDDALTGANQSKTELSSDQLQQGFDDLLSTGEIADMYEGEENYGFIATGN